MMEGEEMYMCTYVCDAAVHYEREHAMPRYERGSAAGPMCM